MGNLITADNISEMNGVQINEYLLEKHNINSIDLPPKRTEKVYGVVIHNTEVVKSDDCGRSYTASTINGNMGLTRTHFYVTDKSAWQNLPLDSTNWTCGDIGHGNMGCISIEIIMNDKSGEANITARDNGAKIAACLLNIFGLTIDDLYTHNYFLNVRDGIKGDYAALCTTPSTERNCPYHIVDDWEGFRNQVYKYQLHPIENSTG